MWSWATKRQALSSEKAGSSATWTIWSLRSPPTSFFQVNPAQTGRSLLIKPWGEYAGLTGKRKSGRRLCGVGSLTLFLARRPREVYGVEVVAEGGGTMRGGKPPKRNGIEDVRFVWPGDGKSPAAAGRIEFGLMWPVVDPPLHGGCRKKELLLEAWPAIETKHLHLRQLQPFALAQDLTDLDE